VSVPLHTILGNVAHLHPTAALLLLVLTRTRTRVHIDDDSLEFIVNQTEMRCLVCEHSQLPKVRSDIGRVRWMRVR
jgi:hypothetical protein